MVSCVCFIPHSTKSLTLKGLKHTVIRKEGKIKALLKSQTNTIQGLNPLPKIVRILNYSFLKKISILSK